MVRRDGVGPVPAWPVIVLTMEEDAAVADPAGVGDPIRVAAYPDLETAAETAAVAAARLLNVTRCRVQGVDSEGSVYVMVVDTEAETLTALEPSTGTVATAGRRGSAFGWAQRIPGRWWLVIGTATAAVVALSVVLVPRTLLPAPAPAPVATGEAPVNNAPIPGAGQLPVQAPVGWNTYAGYVVDAAKPGAAAILVGRTLVIVDGSAVIGLDAKTGQEKWRGVTSADVTELRASDDGDVIYARHDNRGVSVLDASTGEVLGNADITAAAISLADVPFANLPGQAGAVLVGVEWERRQLPATAVPVGTIGEGLVSVSPEREELWVTTSNNPVLPDAVQLTPPGEGLSLSSAVAFVDGRLITEWSDKFSDRVLAIDSVAKDGQLERVTTIDASATSLNVTVDEIAGLVARGGLLIDVSTGTAIQAPEGGMIARAGFGWTVGGGSSVRVDPADGTMQPMPRTAVIPDVILPDGRAIVRAARGADGEAYYALEISPPAATATPETTSTEEEDE